MADFYAEMAAMASDLLAPTSQGGLGQGSVKISRKTVTDPVNSWEQPTVSWSTQTLRAAVSGVSQKLVGQPAGEPDGPVIVATDRQVISAVPAWPYEVNDLVTVDGKPVTVLQVQNIPAAGTVSAVKFIVRG
jgi:hypothetical protein